MRSCAVAAAPTRKPRCCRAAAVVICSSHRPDSDLSGGHCACPSPDEGQPYVDPASTSRYRAKPPAYLGGAERRTQRKRSRALDKDPYWRRSHQLPTVCYCPIHWVALESSCVRCGRSTNPSRRDGIGLLTVRCDCGFDRRFGRGKRVSIPSVLRRLCLVSSSLLTQDTVSWNRLLVRKAVCAALPRRDKSRPVSVMHLLRTRFEVSNSGRYGVTVPVPGTERTLHFYAFNEPAWSAPSVAAMLAVLDLSLK